MIVINKLNLTDDLFKAGCPNILNCFPSKKFLEDLIVNIPNCEPIKGLIEVLKSWSANITDENFLVLVLVLVLISLFLTPTSSILFSEGASTATPEEVEDVKAQLEREFQDLYELRTRRAQLSDQHSREGDMDDPNEENTGKELERVDTAIQGVLESIEKLINWLSN